MRNDIESAAVRVAVRRSIRLGNVNFGYKHLDSWAKRWEEQGLQPDRKYVIKCYKKWAERQHNN